MADERSTKCEVRRVVRSVGWVWTHLLPTSSIKRWVSTHPTLKWWAMPTLLIMVLHNAQVARGAEVINRREQARRMLLATPESTYVHYCAHCHGDDGTGGGRLWPTELSVKPADLTALDAGEDYLIEAIREGSAVHGKSNLCPPWGRTIAAQNIQRLARYIAALGGESSSEPQAPAKRAQPPAKPVRTAARVPAPGLSAASAFGRLAEGPPAPVKEPLPWLLGAVLMVETVVLLWMLRARKGIPNVVKSLRSSEEKEASA